MTIILTKEIIQLRLQKVLIRQIKIQAKKTKEKQKLSFIKIFGVYVVI